MEKKLIVAAGAHARTCCPVSCALPDAPVSARLVDAGSGKDVPCQMADGKLHWVVDSIPAGGSKAYVLSDAPGTGAPGVVVTQREHHVDVKLGNALLATYCHGPDRVRPFLNPVIGPTGVSMVRELFDEQKPPDHDHIHHRGILVAHGEVNETDNWSESKTHAWQTHLRAEALVSGSVFGAIAVENDWQSQDRVHVMFEKRTMTFWNAGGDVRIIDFEIAFRADASDVIFGDTKEGGIVSIRVPTAMRVDRGGRMVNAIGGVGEKECWGKRAHWCDYSGVLEGQQVGIAMFDGAANFRHPTYWHIRNYGLFAANPFGLSYYFNDKSRDGSHTIAKGTEVTFAYRVFIHKGDDRAGGVAEAYHNYANPPEVKLEG